MELVNECRACPESYELRQGGKCIAYFRLRFGRFTVVVPGVGGALVYKTRWPGERFKGGFDSDPERYEEMYAGLVAVLGNDHRIPTILREAGIR